jgi:hypothetical protein
MEIFKNVGENVGVSAIGSSYANMNEDYRDGLGFTVQRDFLVFLSRLIECHG